MRHQVLLVAALVLFAASPAFAQEEEPSAEDTSSQGAGDKKKKEPAKEKQYKDPERQKAAEKFSYCEEDNCYEVLGVEPTAGPVAIKRAYKKLAKEYHPDICPSKDVDKCRKLFPKIANAYEVLSSTEMKKNYDYVVANPYEFPGFYLKYSRPKYAPKSDLRFVFIVTVLGASAMQYLLKKSQHEQALVAMKRSPMTKYQERVKEAMAALQKAKPKSEPTDATPPAAAGKGGKGPPSPAKAKKLSKQEQMELFRKEAEAQVDADLAEMLGAAPTPYDSLAADMFKLPVTTMAMVQWYLAGGHKEPSYMTRKALGMSQLEWDDCTEAEQTELVAKELWLAENLTAHEEEIAAWNAAQGKSGKEKRAKRLAKKNPGAMVMDD